MTRLYLFAQACHCVYISKRACVVGWNRACLGEKVVSEKEYRSAMAAVSMDWMTTAADDLPCQAVERCKCLDTVKVGAKSRSHTLLGG